MTTQPDASADVTQVSVRRAPKVSAFMVVGGLVGFLVTLVVTSLYPVDPNVGFAALLGYFSLFGVTLGVLLGAVVAIALDRRSQRRARVVAAEHQRVDAAPIDGDLE